MQIRTYTLYRPADCSDDQAPAHVVVEPGGPGEAHWMGRGYTVEASVLQAIDAKAETPPKPAASKKASK